MKTSILILVSILSISSAYSQIYSVGSGDGFAFNRAGSAGNLIPLPIELLTFNAKCNNGKAQLNWTILSQINTDYFRIERAINGNNFEIVKIADVNQSMYYNFIDNNPTDANLFYRLKMIDYNGNVKYSTTTAANCDRLQEFTVFPNPSLGKFSIKGLAQKGNLIIRDILGHIVFETAILEGNTEIDLIDIVSGVYMLEIESETGISSMKIIVNR